jgi:hypothetical protein
MVSAAKKLDELDAAPHQIGVQFFQVCNEEGAAEALRDLDDGLRGIRVTAEGILKVVHKMYAKSECPQ